MSASTNRCDILTKSWLRSLIWLICVSLLCRASLETACHEKVKLQSINEELTKQSQMLAQEIDEQNTKLELTNKLLMENLVHKYEEQISELKSEFNSEKCLLTESIKEYETTITSMKEEETRAKIEMIRLQSVSLFSGNINSLFNIYNQNGCT